MKDYLKENNFAKLIFATTNQKDDDKLANIAISNNHNVYRGSNLDVMKRMIKAAEKFNIDVFIRVTGDDILVSCDHMIECLNFHLNNSSDFTKIQGLPIGMGFEIIKISTLKKIHKYIINKKSTEYLSYFLDNNYLLNVNTYKIKKYNKKIINSSLTLDNNEDFKNIKKLISICKDNKKDKNYISTNNIIKNLKYIKTSKYIPKKTSAQINTNLVYSNDK